MRQRQVQERSSMVSRKPKYIDEKFEESKSQRARELESQRAREQESKSYGVLASVSFFFLKSLYPIYKK